MFILQYEVLTTVIDLVIVVFALFVFILVLPCFCCYRFSVNKDLYTVKSKSITSYSTRTPPPPISPVAGV